MTQIYSNTGYARMKNLTITRGSDSSTYSFLAQFSYNGTTYQSITDEQLQKMTRPTYLNRLQSFVYYIYSINDGLQTDCPDMTQGAELYNVDWCPLTEPFPEYEWVNMIP